MPIRHDRSPGHTFWISPQGAWRYTSRGQEWDIFELLEVEGHQRSARRPHMVQHVLNGRPEVPEGRVFLSMNGGGFIFARRTGSWPLLPCRPATGSGRRGWPG